MRGLSCPSPLLSQLLVIGQRFYLPRICYSFDFIKAIRRLKKKAIAANPYLSIIYEIFMILETSPYILRLISVIAASSTDGLLCLK